MKAIDFDEKNFAFTAPPDMPEVYTLPVYRGIDTEGKEYTAPLKIWQGKDPEGVPLIISCWEVTPADIATLINTGKLWLTVVGTGVPPMSLQSEYPFQVPMTPQERPNIEFETMDAEDLEAMAQYIELDPEYIKEEWDVITFEQLGLEVKQFNPDKFTSVTVPEAKGIVYIKDADGVTYYVLMSVLHENGSADLTVYKKPE